MTPDESHGLRRWMESRFDRIDDKLDRETEGLSTMMEQLTIQLVQTTERGFATDARVTNIDAWRSDDGPLDKRFHRHSRRHDDSDAWRHTIRGGLIAVSIFVPVMTGIVVAIVVAALG